MSALCQMLSDMPFRCGDVEETTDHEEVAGMVCGSRGVHDLSCTVLTIARDDAYPSLVEWTQYCSTIRTTWRALSRISSCCRMDGMDCVDVWRR